jgi:outer membrane protein assembly factor BamA
LGSGTPSSAQTSVALREASLAAEAGASPADWFQIAGSVGYEQPRVSRGKDPRFPSIEELFDDPAAPGLLAQPDFIRAGVRATLDWTDRLLGPPTGGKYTVTYDAYDDRDFDRYSFRQWSVDLRQYVPLVTGARTIVLRGFATGVTPNAGHEVPFYYQPTLGGAYSLRMLPAYRLRDRHVLLLQAEYRFELNAFMTGAVFYDAGKVAFRRQDLNTRDLKHDAGFGIRMGFLSNVSLRAEVAFGTDGPRLIFKFNDVF